MNMYGRKYRFGDGCSTFVGGGSDGSSMIVGIATEGIPGTGFG
jgi:hypothetical protein